MFHLSIQVLLALNGSMGRQMMSHWLTKNRIPNLEASEWNELTQILRELFHLKSTHNNAFDAQHSLAWKAEMLSIKEMRNPIFIIVVDIGLLDLTTDIWKEQLNYLEKFSAKVKFAWMLSHDTSSAVKTEIRRKGHVLVVNKPLYKTKMIHILEAILKEKTLEMQKKGLKKEGDHVSECIEIDSTHFDNSSSDDSETFELGIANRINAMDIGEKQKEKTEDTSLPRNQKYINSLVEHTHEYPEEKKLISEDHNCSSSRGNQSNSYSNKTGNEKKSLDGLRILLAEDTPVLQRVASIMLEKMGATVIAVGDGSQAVDAIDCMISTEMSRRESTSPELPPKTPTSSWFDLILMDCQVRNLN